MKTVSRTVIIRESDLNKLMYKIVKDKLYDRVDYEPLTYQGIQHDNMITRLKGGAVPHHKNLPDVYTEMLFREKNLYNRRYLDWDLTMDFPDGQIYVQSRSDHPREPLVLATLEKDYGTL